jgi:hypothetical protein
MKIKNLFNHKTKYQVLIKFLALLAVFITYFVYLSIKFDIITGGMVALLTWSFFVLATPVADAGFLLDFPLRLILGIRMFISEIFVWAAAILINIFALIFAPQDYEKTFLTSLLKKIITVPYPYWIIIILSAIGTFLSIRLGDELLDVISHKERTLHHKHGFKLEILIFLGIFILIFFGYHHLLESLNIYLKH